MSVCQCMVCGEITWGEKRCSCQMRDRYPWPSTAEQPEAWDDKTDPECVVPAPSPPLPEVGSRWRMSSDHGSTYEVLSVQSGQVRYHFKGGSVEHEAECDVASFMRQLEPIPPAPAAEPAIAREHPKCNDGAALGTQRPVLAITPSCLCADDGPGHWDARCPLACWSTGHKFMTCDRCEACGVTGKELRQKERKRACVCLSRDCGECGPKLTEESVHRAVMERRDAPNDAKWGLTVTGLDLKGAGAERVGRQLSDLVQLIDSGATPPIVLPPGARLEWVKMPGKR